MAFAVLGNATAAVPAGETGEFVLLDKAFAETEITRRALNWSINSEIAEGTRCKLEYSTGRNTGGRWLATPFGGGDSNSSGNDCTCKILGLIEQLAGLTNTLDDEVAADQTLQELIDEVRTACSCDDVATITCGPCTYATTKTIRLSGFAGRVFDDVLNVAGTLAQLGSPTFRPTARYRVDLSELDGEYTLRHKGIGPGGHRVFDGWVASKPFGGVTQTQGDAVTTQWKVTLSAHCVDVTSGNLMLVISIGYHHVDRFEDGLPQGYPYPRSIGLSLPSLDSQNFINREGSNCEWPSGALLFQARTRDPASTDPADDELQFVLGTQVEIVEE